jgi:hypothetical protein
MPVATVGIALCLLVVGIPLGVPILGLAAAPFAALQAQRVKALVAYEYRDRPMDENMEPEWVVAEVQAGGKF